MSFALTARPATVSSRAHFPSNSTSITSSEVRRPFHGTFVKGLVRRGTVARAQEVDPHGDRYPNWDDIQKQLVGKYGLPSIGPEDAASMIQDGKAVLLDVRLQQDIEEASPKDAVAAPAFRIIDISQGGGIARMMKMALMTVNGVTPTEPNPDFIAAAKNAAGSDKAVIVACEAGGSSAATGTWKSGKASRSLKAAWKLLATDTLSADRVYHLESGVLGWYMAGMPMSGEYNSARAFKSPNAVAVVDEEK